MGEIVKTCSIHGDLTIEQTRKDGDRFRCKACRAESNRKTYYAHREKRVATSLKWKQQNRGDYNEWCRQDRKNNPEKYRKYEAAAMEKIGRINYRRREVLRQYGLSTEQHDAMIAAQDNKCAICGKEETRKGRSGDVAPLCIDDCHKAKEQQGIVKVRGLLCHSCNTGIGKLRDDIDLMQKAIAYLEKHQQI